MSLKSLGLILIFLFVTSLNAHEANEAFFTFRKNEQFWQVEAELPWTAREGLISFKPSLEHATSKKEFQQAFDEYVKQFFKLYDQNGNALQYIKHEEIPNHSNGHKNNFYLYFDSGEIERIHNALLFNVSSKHTNYHFLGDLKFMTTVDYPLFELSNKTNYVFYLLFLFGSIVLFFGIKRLFFRA